MSCSRSQYKSVTIFDVKHTPNSRSEPNPDWTVSVAEPPKNFKSPSVLREVGRSPKFPWNRKRSGRVVVDVLQSLPANVMFYTWPCVCVCLWVCMFTLCKHTPAHVPKLVNYKSADGGGPHFTTASGFLGLFLLSSLFAGWNHWKRRAFPLVALGFHHPGCIKLCIQSSAAFAALLVYKKRVFLAWSEKKRVGICLRWFF